MPRQSISIRMAAPHMIRVLLLAALTAGLTQNANAQFGADLWDEFDLNSDRTTEFDSEEDPRFQPVNTGANWRARVGHLAFETFGRSESITHVELMPIIPLDNAAVFSDWRLFIDANGEVGTNLGLGYRQWVDELDHVVGASLWYDGDNTSSEFFNQLGLTLELLGDDWDLLSNVYIPVGNDNRNYSVSNTNATIMGSQLMFDQVRDAGEAMPGIDMEFGLLIPTEFGVEHEVRAYAGWYFFSGDDRSDINGSRFRIQGDLTDNITARVEVTDDKTFGTNVIFGGSIVLPGSLSADRSSARRRERHLARFTQRNYNVIVSRATERTTGLTAMNASTGNAFDIRQIQTGDTFAGTSGGSTADTVFVVDQGVSLDENISLIDGQQLLSAGTGQSVFAAGFGDVMLPGGSSGTAPILTNSAGDAITLASNTRVAGFTIDGASGHGVTGSGIMGATLSGLTIQNSGMDNLFLENVAGPLTLAGLTLGDATGASFHLDGTTSDVSLAGTISNSSGRTVLIENTSDDTTVDLRDATITDSGAGLLVSNVAGDVQFSDVTVTGSTGTGIEVTGNSGTVIFGGLTSVSGTTGPGINVHDTVDLALADDPDTAIDESAIIEGQVFFNEINVATSGQTGLVASNATNLLVLDGTINATSGGAIADITDSAIDVRLTSIFADGGPFGVNIANTTGTFAALGDGTGTSASAGLIQNTTTALTLQNAGTVYLQFVDFDANQHIVSDSGSERVAIASSNITNTSGGALGTNAALVAQNSRSLEFTNSTYDGTNSIELLDSTYSTNNSFSATFASNTITSAAGDVFNLTGQAGSEGATLALTQTGNIITLNPDNATALDVSWAGVIQSTIANNTITGQGNTNTGIRYVGTSTTDLSQMAVQNNLFTFNGTFSRGVDLTAAGPGQFTVASNSFDFNDSNGIGMRFHLDEAASIAITSNFLSDDGSAARAVLFAMLADGSSVAIENNLFNFNTASAAIDEGIVFQAVETGGTVTLSGNVDNVINNASNPFVILPGTTVGGFPVNGVLVP